MKNKSFNFLLLFALFCSITACVIINDPAQAASAPPPPLHLLNGCSLSETGGKCEGTLRLLNEYTYRKVLNPKITEHSLIILEIEALSPINDFEIGFDQENVHLTAQKTENGFLLKEKVTLNDLPNRGAFNLYWRPVSGNASAQNIQYQISYTIKSGLLKDGK